MFTFLSELDRVDFIKCALSMMSDDTPLSKIRCVRP